MKEQVLGDKRTLCGKNGLEGSAEDSVRERKEEVKFRVKTKQ